MTDARAHYISDGAPTVPGWFHLADRLLFDVVDEAQRSLGYTGDLLEIGVFRGCSAILLGYMVADGEELTVCDLFGAPAPNDWSARENATFYAGLTQAAFEENYLRFHARLPRVSAGSSALLRGRCEERAYRFLHIDGSHVYADVMDDLLLTRDLARSSDAVVVVDDFLSGHTPGVWAATWECVFRHDLIPIIASGSKLYASWGSPSSALVEALRSGIAGRPELVVATDPIAGGREIMRVTSVAPRPRRSLTRRVVRRAATGMGIGRRADLRRP